MAQHINKKARFHSVTANRLLDGEPVYLTKDNGWSDALADAAIADGKEEGAELLEQGKQGVVDQIVVNPYLFDVDAEGGAPQPISVREQIRAAGPTVRLDLGKQAS
jgi:hypothetical protein